MKLAPRFLAGFLCLSINLTAFIALPAQNAFGQDSKTALQRGYRTGYSDGYMAGYRDVIDKSVKDITRHSDYDKASRAYNKEYGALDDYRDGYRQGFEPGYAAGYEKKSFESAVPENIERRGLNQVTMPVEATAPPQTVQQPVEQPVSAPAVKAEVPAVQTQASQPTTEPSAAQQSTPPAAAPVYSENTPNTPGTQIKTTFTPVSDAVIIIPKDTELILELEQPLTTEKNKAGDQFTAKIVSPTELSGAIIEGRISKITRPGHIKRRSEMQLSFDRIVLTESRWSNYSASLIQIYPAKGDNIKRVDNEGLAQGTRPYKSDFVKIGAATGTGTVIGAVAGGPVGAGIGAGIGAAVGVGAVIIERGNHINLRNSQQLRVRTSYETQIR